MGQNLEVTNIDNRDLLLGGEKFQDELLTLAGADELKAGTILARSSATEKLVLFVKGGSTNENGIPKVVLPYAVSASGSGDVSVRVLVAGEVDASKLVIDADGDDSNIDAPVRDQLRSYGIVPVDLTDNSTLDNQPEDS